MSNLIAVAAAALIGFTGNELVARYRIRVGRKIGSAALVADGLHARTVASALSLISRRFSGLAVAGRAGGRPGKGRPPLPWLAGGLVWNGIRAR